MLLGVQPVQGEKPVLSSAEFDETSNLRVPALNEIVGIEDDGIENAGSEALHDFGFDMDMRRQECHAK